MKKSPKSNQVASQLKPAAIDASSSAAVIVGPAGNCGDALVPSQGCGPPPLSIGLPSVVIGPSNSVEAEPSTRTWTVTGAAGAGAQAERTAIAVAETNRLNIGA